MDFGVRMSNLHNLFKSLWNRQVFLYLVSFALIWAVLLTLNLFLSRDIDDYGVNFNLAKAQNLSERLLAINWLKDPAYFLAQAFSAGMMPISIFFGIIIASCLALKWLALRQLVDRPGWIIILPYLCVLSFLHEGTQIRIAIALSIALWSLVLWSKEKYLNAFLLILLAASFHISGITFLLPYTIIWLADRFGKVLRGGLFFRRAAAVGKHLIGRVADLLQTRIRPREIKLALCAAIEKSRVLGVDAPHLGAQENDIADRNK